MIGEGGVSTGYPSPPRGPPNSRDNGIMTEQDQDRDPWDEFDKLKPAAPDRVEGYPGGEPQGFGFRTGVRSARVALGFAVYALVLGTLLVVTGAIVFVGNGQWLLLGLMVPIEAVFILAFVRLVAMARSRRSAR
jgi:hypothetical protein